METKDSQNDPLIKITIRTPTSTRPYHVEPSRSRRESRREPRNRRNTSPERITLEYSIIPLILEGEDNLGNLGNLNPINQPDYLNTIFNYILNRSFEEKHELTRNPDIKLDIQTSEATTQHSSETCPICMNSFKPKETISIIPNCSHIIHTSCITEWGYYKQECPLCRIPIKVLEE